MPVSVSVGVPIEIRELGSNFEGKLRCWNDLYAFRVVTGEIVGSASVSADLA